MRINTAFILCAGFGKRLNPLTLDTPKPLIKLNNITVLETCINLIESLGHKANYYQYFLFKRSNS
jgi:MurNAc alpha-1-phosphate uridylyltransferase